MIGIGKYIAAKPRKGNVTLTFSREWAGSSLPIVSQLAAQRMARLAIRNGIPSQSVYSIGDGETPSITVPAAYLANGAFAFSVSPDGEAMAARIEHQRIVSSFQRSKAGRRGVKRYASQHGWAL